MGRFHLRALPPTFTPGWLAWLFTDIHSVTFSKYESQQRRGVMRDSKEKNGCLRGVSSQQHQRQNDRKCLAVVFKIKREMIAAGRSGRDKVNTTAFVEGTGKERKVWYDGERSGSGCTQSALARYYLDCTICARINLSGISAVCTEVGISVGPKKTGYLRGIGWLIQTGKQQPALVECIQDHWKCLMVGVLRRPGFS